MVIPPEEICVEDDPMGGIAEDIASGGITAMIGDEDCKKIELPGVSGMQPFPNGGLRWDEDILLKLDPDDYYSADKLTLYALSSGIADMPLASRKLSDLSLMSEIADYSDDYKDRLQPTYG